MKNKYEAVLFDLLSALLDSWSLWNELAGEPNLGRQWRMRYLQLTYGSKGYEPYLQLVARAAEDVGLVRTKAHEMEEKWAELKPWPGAKEVIADLASSYVLALSPTAHWNSAYRLQDSLVTTFTV